jgi:hypothetical protein
MGKRLNHLESNIANLGGDIASLNGKALMLVLIFLISFSVKILPLLLGCRVPFGWVDTAYHISTALDVKEGNFKSLFHPWWHIPNHIFEHGVDLVDRNSKSFLYPPLLHVLLALFMVFTHPGIATITTISFLYSLSVISIFLLCKSYGLSGSSSLISSLIVGFSSSLTYSQNFGFWTFSIALIFSILSYSFLQFYLKNEESRMLNFSLVFGSLATLTHWLFGAALLISGVLSLNVGRGCKKFLLYFGSLYILFLLFFLTFTDTLSYEFTYFHQIFLETPVLYLLMVIGWVLAIKKYKKNPFIHLLPPLVSALMVAHYILNIKIPLVDMLQFTLPFFTAFYASHIYQFLRERARVIYLILIILLLIVQFYRILDIQLTTKPSLSNEQFDSLLNLRSTFSPNSTTILGMEGRENYWITLVSKDSKIINPFNMTSIQLKNFQIYLIKPTDNYFVLTLLQQ